MDSTTTTDPHARIAALPCFRDVRGVVSIEPLAGGITNRNYLVLADGARYVVRMSDDLRHLGVDRRCEALAQKSACDLGVAPAVLHREPGVLLSEFVDGRTLTAADVRDEDRLRRIALTLRRLHDGMDRLRGEFTYFCPFLTARTYALTACALGAALPDSIDADLADATELSREIAPFRPTLCHNDLLPANLIETEAGIALVDWEYGGIGNPYFDLASLAGNACLPPELERVLVESWRGGADERALREVRVLRAASLLREALWACIQTKASAIEFDYARYAAECFASYREARAALG